MTYEISPLEQVERFNKLAEVIESHPDQFDMSWWVQVPDAEMRDGRSRLNNVWEIDDFGVDMLAPFCGTRGCVAGWAASLWAGELTVEQNLAYSIETAAQMLLGLDSTTRSWLFDADAQHQEAHQAAAVLRDLAEYVSEHGSTDGFTD